MEAWAEFLEEPGLLDPKFTSRRGRMENWRELYDLVCRQARGQGLLQQLLDSLGRNGTTGTLSWASRSCSERGFCLHTF